ncbi:MAG: DUF2231 domain-containing protein [Anaerolineales bacterium]
MKILGHPIHPMLIVFPLGLFATAVVFDILFLSTANLAFPTVSYYMIAAGIIGGLLAAVFGFADWTGLPGNSRAKQIGLWHGLGNFVIVLLFIGSWLLRRGSAGFTPNGVALFLSFAGVAMALVTGWLGGELVYRLGSNVDRNANVNAPSSLKNPSASAPSGTKRPSHR